MCSSSSAGKYGVQPEDVLLVHDELDKPLGKMVIKHGGSARSVSAPDTRYYNHHYFKNIFIYFY